MTDELPLAQQTGAGSAGRRVGRPPILDADVTKRVADIIRGGNYPEVAAASVGISRETFYKWLRDGARIRRTLEPLEEEAYDAAVEALTSHEWNMAQFSDTVESATADSEVIDVLNVRKAAGSQWQAAMTRLERRHPKRWGRREAVEVSGQLDGVRVDAQDPQQAADASKALQSARTRELAADLIEQLASTNDDPQETNP